MSTEVLVTGGLGFIGSHLCERLLADGHRVSVVDCRNGVLYHPSVKTKHLKFLQRHDGFTFYDKNILNTRDLDWRVYARNDRHVIKQYIEETNLRATILLDGSGSMKYVGDLASKHRGKALSKFEYGRLVAASLSHLMIHQQDAVGLVTFDTV